MERQFCQSASDSEVVGVAVKQLVLSPVRKSFVDIDLQCVLVTLMLLTVRNGLWYTAASEFGHKWPPV